jgi:hypothetical protein
VFAQHAIAGDIWTMDRQRYPLHHASVVGIHPQRLYPNRQPVARSFDPMDDRQVRVFEHQRYIPMEDIPNPSVITLNALGASQAVNDFLFIVTGLFDHDVQPEHILISPRSHMTEKIHMASDPACSMCGFEQSSLYGRGDRGRLPCRE